MFMRLSVDDKASEALGNVSTKFSSLTPEAQAAESAVSSASAEMEGGAEQTQKLAEGVDDVSTNFNTLVSEAQAAGSAVNSAGDELGGGAQSTATLSEKIQGLNSGFIGISGAVREGMGWMDRYQISQLSVYSSTLQVESAQERYNVVVKQTGPDSDAAIQAGRQLEIQQINLEKANMSAESSLIAIGVSMVSMVGQVTTMSLTVNGAKTSLIEFALSGTVMSTVQSVVTGSLAAMGAAFKAFTLSLLTNPVTLILVAIAAAVVLLYIAWQNNFGGIREITAGVWDYLSKSFVWLMDTLGWMLGPIYAIYYAFTHWSEIVGVIGGVIDSIKRLIFGVNEQTDAEKKLNAVNKELKDSTKEMAKGAKDAEEGLKALKSATKDLESAEKQLIVAKKDLLRLDRDIADAEESLAGTHLDVREATLGLRDAQNEYNTALSKFGTDSREYEEADIRLERAKLRLKDATDGEKDAEDKLGDVRDSAPERAQKVAEASDLIKEKAEAVIKAQGELLSKYQEVEGGVVLSATLMADGTIQQVARMADDSLVHTDYMKNGMVERSILMADGTVLEMKRLSDGTVSWIQRTKDGVIINSSEMKNVTVAEFSSMNQQSVQQTQSMSTGVSSITGTLYGILVGIWEALKNAIISIIQALDYAVRSIFGALYAWAKGIYDTIVGWYNSAVSMINSVSGGGESSGGGGGGGGGGGSCGEGSFGEVADCATPECDCECGASATAECVGGASATASGECGECITECATECATASVDCECGPYGEPGYTDCECASAPSECGPGGETTECDVTVSTWNKGGPVLMAGGNEVPGIGVSDTVPALLTPGEYVLPKGSWEKGKGSQGITVINNFNAPIWGIDDFEAAITEAFEKLLWNIRSRV